jgi:uncharacterized membrane protein YgdD (TMEM256/DUF423 family)
MERTWLALGAGLAFLAVAAGAFGAHALKAQLSDEALAWFETGVRYHMYHALALVALAALAPRLEGSAATWSGWLFVAGVALFSGSLYLLALTGVRWLGAVTPLGGVCLLAGWAALVWAALRS